MRYITPDTQIVRSKHEKNFHVQDNLGLYDNRLDPTAFLILSRRVSKPDTWKLIPKALAKEIGKNVETVRKYIRQLVQYGYLMRRVLKDSYGRFLGYHYVLVEDGNSENVRVVSVLPPSPESGESVAYNPVVSKKTESSVRGKAVNESPRDIVNIEDSKYRSKKILDLSPTPQKFQYQEEEIDFWLDSPSESIQPEVAQTKSLDLEVSNVDQQEPELTANLSTAIIPGEERSSAVDYIQTTVSNIKPTRKERQSAQRNTTWVEFGKENGLWKSLEELQGFMTALYRHAVNNPRLHTPSKWVESEVQKTCDRGTGTHWVEYITGLEVGTIDQKPWTDVSGNVDLSFRSYVEQSKFGESGNSTSRAVELAAQVLSDPFKAGLLWNEYQRRLERELEEKAKCDLLGVAYRVAGVLMPKSLVSAAATAQTQQVLGIDAAAPLCQLPITSGATCGHVWSEATSDPCVAGREAIAQSVAVPVLEAEVDSSLGEAPWDLIAAKMAMLGEKMGIAKSGSGAIPLSEVYGEPKPVNFSEAKEFSVWYDLAKAQGLVDYSYADSKCHAIVVLVDGVTALPWREARDLLLE
jgi:hypothetical protein